MPPSVRRSGSIIEENELPDDADVREVFEESGLRVELVGDKREDLRTLCSCAVPRGCSSRTSRRGTST